MGSFRRDSRDEEYLKDLWLSIHQTRELSGKSLCWQLLKESWNLDSFAYISVTLPFVPGWQVFTLCYNNDRGQQVIVNLWAYWFNLTASNIDNHWQNDTKDTWEYFLAKYRQGLRAFWWIYVPLIHIRKMENINGSTKGLIIPVSKSSGSNLHFF